MARLTMKEIAQRADVSQSTVSRVINGNTKVSAEIIEKVMAVIEQEGFVPNRAAQTLKKNQSNIIGLIVSEIYNPYFVEIIDTLEKVLREKGYNLLLHNSNHNPLMEWEGVQNFIARQCDGVIIIPVGDYNLNRLQQLHIPIVCMTQTRKEFDSIGLNHTQAGKLVAEKFVLNGHKKAMFIGTEDDKFYGFQSALIENGLSFDINHNFIEVPLTSTTNFLVKQDIETYLRTNKQLDFTAVFASNDINALEFIRAVESKNMKVPEDIAVVGFDDTYLSKIMGISSIHQPIETMVRSTVDIMLNKINDEVSNKKVQILLEPTLIERDSSRL